MAPHPLSLVLYGFLPNTFTAKNTSLYITIPSNKATLFINILIIYYLEWRHSIW